MSTKQQSSASPTAWGEAHEKLVQIAKKRTSLDHEEATWLLVAHREKTHVHLGFGSFAEYVERTCGYTPRQSHERIRVALAMGGLPVICQALSDGELSWSAVRELIRVATNATETQWVEATCGRTLRQIERLVAGAAPGDAPNAPRQPEAKRHVLRLEVSAETYATYREATGHLQREAGGGLDEEAALLIMSRQVLGGPKDEGRASYQIAMTVCPECGHGEQQGRGEAVAVDDEIVEMAQCDAQRLPDPNTHVGQSRAAQDIPPATRRAVMRRDGKCVVPGCRHATFLDIHHIKLRSEGGDHDPDTLVCLCSAHHTAAHRAALIVEGSISGGLRFYHADGTEYGGRVCADVAGAQSDAFLALKSFGFKESIARAALVRAGRDGGDVPTLVRAALRLLHPPTRTVNEVREPEVTYAGQPRRRAA
jgi:hypothetical protein